MQLISTLPAETLRRALLAVLLFGVTVLGACAVNPRAGGQFPGLAQYQGKEISSVSFAGEVVLPRDSLQAIIETQPTRCRLLAILPICIPRLSTHTYHNLDLDVLARDVARLQLYHRDHGYYGTRVNVSVEPTQNDAVAVRFAIAPGDQVILGSLTVEGLDSILPVEPLEQKLPLEVGGPFRRVGFLASADSIRAALYQRGYAYADVLRNYSIDTIADRAEADFIAIPGPQVHIDTIVVLGADRIGERTVRRQLTFHKGQLLRTADLNQSQRNLYALEMVSFASVELAPDSLQVSPDSANATVIVRVVEAPQYVVDTAVGIGTVDCVRGGATWVNRNFIGGARRLEVSGSVSRIGVGAPTAWGFEHSVVCRNAVIQIGRDSIDRLNYRATVSLKQPRLFATQTQLGIDLFAQRQTELNAYLREAVGTRVALTRELTRQTLIATTLDVERGATTANEAVFCLLQNVCSVEDQRILEGQRWSNSLVFSAVYDGTTTTGFSRRGYLLRGSSAWASELLGSDDRYLNLVGEGAAYRTLRPGWVLAARLQAGGFVRGSLQPGGRFIPPDRRFYAGGPNSVRGFPPNGLGPQVYVADSLAITAGPDGAADTSFVGVRSSSTGGTQLVLGTLELRTPSPFLSQYLRLAAFVDAGQVRAPEVRLGNAPVAVTPGVGVRVQTPVGPFRVDVAYNPRGAIPGPLYTIDPQTRDLILVRPEFRPAENSFWSRLEFQFAVGQAF